MLSKAHEAVARASGFRPRAAQEFLARRRVVEQPPHGDGRPAPPCGLRDVEHRAAGGGDAGTRTVRGRRLHQELGDGADRRKRLAASGRDATAARANATCSSNSDPDRATSVTAPDIRLASMKRCTVAEMPQTIGAGGMPS